MHGQMGHVGRCGVLGCHSDFRFVTVVPLVPRVGDGTFGHVDEKVVLRVEPPRRVVGAGGPEFAVQDKMLARERRQPLR